MDMVLTEEQEMLQQSIKRFFEKEVSIELIRELQSIESDGYSKDLWKKTGEAGWLAIAIPEKYGGAGGTILDLGILYEESGRVLFPTTIYSTLFASFIIEAIGTEEQKLAQLPKLVSGSQVHTVAYQEAEALHDPNCYSTSAELTNGKYYLSGTKMFVANAHLADQIIVFARTKNQEDVNGLTAFRLSAQTKGIEINPQSTFGKDRQSIVEFVDVELTEENILGEVHQAETGLNIAIQKATALQTMEMVGGMKKVIQMTVDYVSERKQFGVSIGSFQAVQHHLANLATLRDGAELVANQAVSVLSKGEDANREVSIAKATANHAYKEITILAHQLWGGMGYATESDLYLWSNRAKSTELSFGTRDYHLKNLNKYISTVDNLVETT